MGIGDIIYSLITLILMIVIIFSPLLRKMMKSAEKYRNQGPGSEDSMYESVDSHRVVERILAEQQQVPHIEFSEPKALNHTENKMYDEGESLVNKLDRMTPLKRAVIWKEILDKPVGMK